MCRLSLKLTLPSMTPGRLVAIIALTTLVEALRHAPTQTHPGPKLSQACAKQLDKLADSKFQKEAAKCEQEGKFPDQVIEALQKMDQAAAVSHAEAMFIKCAKFSQDCAAEVAPGLVMELRFSGAAVSNKCMKQVQDVRKDPKTMKAAAKCEKDEKIGETILSALHTNNLPQAVSAAEKGLKTCMHVESTCAYQVAPVVVNSVVMEAMKQQHQQQAPPMTVVLTKGSMDSFGLSLQGQHKKKVSMLNMAVPKFPLSKHGAVLLQLPRRSKWVSRLVLELASSGA